MTRPVPEPGSWGARLRAARNARNWTQTQLGKKVGVSYYTVSDWELNRGISEEKLRALAKLKGEFKTLAEQRLATAAFAPPPELLRRAEGLLDRLEAAVHRLEEK